MHRYFSAEDVAQKEAELRAEALSIYIDSMFVQRLRGVSFLGVLDFVYQLNPISNRYDHTICVSHLALELSRQLRLSRELQRAFVIANILHDVGHAAFSHNSEPFLVEQLNLYHQGLLSAFFMQSNRFAANGVSLAQLIRSERDEVANSDVVYRLGTLTNNSPVSFVNDGSVGKSRFARPFGHHAFAR